MYEYINNEIIKKDEESNTNGDKYYSVINRKVFLNINMNNLKNQDKSCPLERKTRV